MIVKTVFAIALFTGSLLLVAPASADPIACAPGSFPDKPVPGGVVGQTWDTVKTTYDGSAVAGFCGPDPNDGITLVTNTVESGCVLLVGETCLQAAAPALNLAAWVQCVVDYTLANGSPQGEGRTCGPVPL